MLLNRVGGENNIFEDVGKQLNDVIKDPSGFLLPLSPEKQEPFRLLLQDTYRLSVQNGVYDLNAADILPTLVLEGMDEEQLWQQLELRNDSFLLKCADSFSKLLSTKENKLEIRLNETFDDDLEKEEDIESENDEESDLSEKYDSEDKNEEYDTEEEVVLQKNNKKKKTRPSIVDDTFFKLREMESFLEQEDAKEMKKNQKKPIEDDEGVDYFAEDLGFESEDEDETNPGYKDFFESEDEEHDNCSNKVSKNASKNDFEKKIMDENKKRSNDRLPDNDESQSEGEGDEENESNIASKALGENDENEENDSDNSSVMQEEQPKSSFELRQARQLQRIRDYEEEVLGEKPWQLKGEVKANSRPQNSLLEEILEFESTVAPPPLITEETTRCLEDIIRQRIKDQAWDDVELKVRPVQTPQDYKKQLVLDQEKSKQSLSQVYEKEYQRELKNLDVNRGELSTPEEETKEHKEIRRLMHDLFIKLDALTNFHFIPKPVAPEAKIITNMPVVQMEEVAPVLTSDAKLLAPKELYRGPKNTLIGKTERNRTDKNRERRKKKQKQRAINNVLEAKSKNKPNDQASRTKEENAKLLKSLTKHRNVEKINVTNGDQKALKSSKSFFSKLQDTTRNFSKGAANDKKRKIPENAAAVKKLKL